jgi:hypothetical protein
MTLFHQIRLLFLVDHALPPSLLIISDPFGDLARRRRTLIILSFALLFIPLFFYLLILLSSLESNNWD